MARDASGLGVAAGIGMGIAMTPARDVSTGWTEVDDNILAFSLKTHSVSASEAGRSMYPPRPSGTISIMEILVLVMLATRPSFCPI